MEATHRGMYRPSPSSLSMVPSSEAAWPRSPSLMRTRAEAAPERWAPAPWASGPMVAGQGVNAASPGEAPIGVVTTLADAGGCGDTPRAARGAASGLAASWVCWPKWDGGDGVASALVSAELPTRQTRFGRSSSSRMLSGLTSRWAMPRVCKWCRAWHRGRGPAEAERGGGEVKEGGHTVTASGPSLPLAPARTRAVWATTVRTAGSTIPCVRGWSAVVGP